MVERRQLAVLLRAQPLEPGLAGVDGDPAHPGGGEGGEEVRQHPLRVLLVDPDAALHRDRHRPGRRDHRRGAVGRPAPASCISAAPKQPDCTRSDGQPTLRLISSKPRSAPMRAAARQLPRLGAAELQRQRPLLGVVAEQPRPVPVQHRRRRHHLGIEQRPPGEAAVEEPAVPVGPVHHGRDG